MSNIDQRIDKHKATTYRTSHYTEEQVAHLKESANKQEKDIARLFFKNSSSAIGPTVVHQMLFPGFPDKRGDWPITSTRRAIKNLTQSGILIMTPETNNSLLGGTEHLWRWRRPTEEIQKNKPMSHREIVAKHAGKQMNFYEQFINRNK